MCFHPSVSLNNEKNCCAINEDKIAICEKTAGLGSGNFSDLNSVCRKVLVPVKIFQFQDMLNESVRYRDRTNGLSNEFSNHLLHALLFSTNYALKDKYRIPFRPSKYLCTHIIKLTMYDQH